MSLNPKQIKEWKDLEENIEIILSIGPYIHFEPVLVYKLVRIMRSFLKQVKKETHLKYVFMFYDLNFLPSVNC